MNKAHQDTEIALNNSKIAHKNKSETELKNGEEED